MSTSSHQLAEEVFVCLSGSRFVFLDLRHDRYFCLNGRDTRTATHLFTDFSWHETSGAPEQPGAEEFRTIARTLEDSGLLVQGGTSAKVVTPVRIQTAENTLHRDTSCPVPTVRTGHWLAFFRAAIKASWKLRRYSMQRTVQSIDKRKQRSAKAKTTAHYSLPELVAIFQHLRPFYIREYLCLYDSLALLEFLAIHNHFPKWVFGVTTEPFNAHCWVQTNACVLNDSVEYVSGYTPIMAV